MSIFTFPIIPVYVINSNVFFHQISITIITLMHSISTSIFFQLSTILNSLSIPITSILYIIKITLFKVILYLRAVLLVLKQIHVHGEPVSLHRHGQVEQLPAFAFQRHRHAGTVVVFAKNTFLFKEHFEILLVEEIEANPCVLVLIIVVELFLGIIPFGGIIRLKK